MGDRCTGRCCRDFFLPFTPESLRAAAARAQEERLAELPLAPGVTDLPSSPQSHRAELEQIAAMVVPFRPAGPDSSRGYRYSCVNLDEDGDCAIYDRRPDMCRNYPYGHRCDFGTRCDWDAAREGGARDPGQDVRRARDPVTHAVLRVHLRMAPEPLPLVAELGRLADMEAAREISRGPAPTAQ